LRKIFVILSLLLSANLIAQEPSVVFEDTVSDFNLIKLTSYNSYSSNRFNNEFIDKFLFGGEITSEIKDANSARLKGRNVIGGEFEQRIDSYTPSINMFNKEAYGMKLSFSDNHYFSANLSEDIFNLAMYGNANYIGDTMDLTFSTLQYQHYQKFGVGFYDERNMSSIQVSYIAGSKTLKGALDESWLYSQSTLDTIDVKASGNMFTSDRFYPYWGFQGSGFSIDIDYNFIFEGKVKNRQIINFKINNLGMIFWNRNTKQYNMNLNGVYAGVDVQDLLNQDSTIDNSIDWMDTLGISTTTGFQVDVLPLELVVQKVADYGIDKKWQGIFGLKVVMVPEYFPYLYGGAYFKASDKFSISSRLSYGGWAGLRWGLNFNYWVKDKLYFAAGTFDLIGLVSKKIGYGRGVNFSMYYKL
jgi:hypothetical protein